MGKTQITPEQRQQYGMDFYRQIATEMEQAIQGSQKTFDQGILTLSSGAVALLLTFAQAIKGEMQDRIFLFFATGAFLFALSLTLTSFLLVPQVIKNQLGRAYRYYVECQEDGVDDESCAERMVKGMNVAAAVAFVFGMLFGVIFVAFNMRGVCNV